MGKEQEEESGVNPVIADFASKAPFSPVEYVWFDFTDYHKHRDFLNEHLASKSLDYFVKDGLIENLPMPFDRMACVLPVKIQKSDELKMMMVTALRVIHTDKPSELLFCTWGNDKEPSTTVHYQNDIFGKFSLEISEELNQKFKKENRDSVDVHKNLVSIMIWMIIATTQQFSTNRNAYKCTANPKNPSRAKRGKRPLFEWETVTIKPQQPRQSLGGTHASPKPHDRRGHQRRYKSGKVVYVRPHTINKHKIPTEGFIHHDYKVSA